MLIKSYTPIIYQTTSRLYRKWYKSKLSYVNSRKNRAPFFPFKLYSVSPDMIHKPKRNIGNKFECDVKKGDWDLNYQDFSNTITYTSFKNRFVHNWDWKETDLFTRSVNKIATQGEWKECHSQEDILNQLSYYDKLYKNIKNEGYKLQDDLFQKSINSEQLKIKYRPLEFEEITIDVGRDGTLLWYSGAHRLCIARILNIQSIPVRIRIRHKKWQEKRNEIWIKSKEHKNKDVSHPDLVYLLDVSENRII